MGQYRLEFEAVGGHGCQREHGDGAEVYGCRRMDCPDCVTQEYVEKMHKMGQSDIKAKFIHWPGQPSEVVDEFVLPKRTVESYEQSAWNESTKKFEKTGELGHYVSERLIHRVRHGSFNKL